MGLKNRKAGYGHEAFYEYENYVNYGLIFHTYWKERFYNRLKLRDGKGKSYGKRPVTPAGWLEQVVIK